jgi:hypothetical protein
MPRVQMDGPTLYFRPFDFVYAKQGDVPYTKFSHSSQQLFAFPLAIYYRHKVPPHAPSAEYSSVPKEVERYMAMEGGTNRAPSTHLEYPWARGQHNEARRLAPLDPRVDGLPTAVVDIVRKEIAKAFRDKLRVSMYNTGQPCQKPYDSKFDIIPYPLETIRQPI